MHFCIFDRKYCKFRNEKNNDCFVIEMSSGKQKLLIVKIEFNNSQLFFSHITAISLYLVCFNYNVAYDEAHIELPNNDDRDRGSKKWQHDRDCEGPRRHSGWGIGC